MADLETQTKAALEYRPPRADAPYSDPPLGPESVPPLDLPQGASPEDKWTGVEDELGNRIYVTLFGKTYKVSMNPDQRTLRTKVTEDVVPAVKEYLKDPSLPTAGQALSFGKGLVEGVYEPVAKAVRGEGTYGDILDTTGLIATGGLSGAVPKGSLRSFGGKTKQYHAPIYKKKSVISSEGPDITFGSKKLRDLFEEDNYDKPFSFNDEGEWDLGDLEGFTPVSESYDSSKLGYARNMDLHTLAEISLGRVNLEEALDYIGTDATPEAISYISSRLNRLSNNPEFVDYKNRLEANPGFDFIKAYYENLPKGKADVVFRSPVPEVLDNMAWPKKGKDGYQIISELQKNPSVLKSELDTILPEIDKTKKYTLDEAQEVVKGNLWDTRVRVLNSNDAKWEAYQRQPINGPHKDYFELLINSERASPDKSGFKPKGSHFQDETLAHARASVQEDQRGDFILVEEIQSDLLQHGALSPQKGKVVKSPAQVVEESPHLSSYDNLDKKLLQLIGEDRDPTFFDWRGYKDFVLEVGPENLIPNSSLEDVLTVLAKETGGQTPSEKLLGLYTNYKVGFKNTNAWTSPQTDTGWDYWDNLKDTYYNVVAPEVSPYNEPGISSPPLKRVEDSVRMTLTAMISEADARGIDRIIIPPLEQIVSRRFTKGTEQFEKAMKPNSLFSKIYTTYIQDAVRDLQKEVGLGNISSRLVDLDYTEGPTTGLEIDFTGLRKSDYDIKTPKFAEGGLTMDEQMNKLFAEGGVNTGDIKQDPISGNEVPPGSLPEEVRDDIPAKLSSGEYVIPADVLRYYGVAFFEKLRTKAKQGLSEMDSEGRIGGDTEGPQETAMEQGEEEDFPFSLEELQAEDDSLEMAEGGVVPETPTANFDPNKFSYSPTTGATGSQMKQYKDKNGNIVQVLFINGKPIVDVDALGYTLYDPATETTAAVATGEEVKKPEKTDENPQERDKFMVKGDTEKSVRTPTKAFKDVNWASTSPAEAANLIGNSFDPTFGDKLGTALGSLLGGSAGGGLGLAAGGKLAKTAIATMNLREAASAIATFKASGNTAAAEAAQAKLDELSKDIPNGAKLLAGLGAVEPFDIGLPKTVETPTSLAPKTSSGGKSMGISTPASIVKDATSRGDGGDKSGGLSYSKDVTGGKSAAESLKSAGGTMSGGLGFGKDVSGSPNMGPSGNDFSMGTPVKEESYDQKIARGGGFKKGGLVAKPKPAAKKAPRRKMKI